MTIKTPTDSTSLLHEILNWSNDRPIWQRDALRRIFTKTALDDTDISQLEEICRANLQNQVINLNPVIPLPLTLEHLPPNSNEAKSVIITSISELKNVNRIPNDSLLPLGENGLTIVYGENGAGKSGYARILKKACRARGESPSIRPNVFDIDVTNPAAATIHFKVDSESVSIRWVDNSATDSRLANVFVFDSSSAEHYLKTDSGTAFTPYGLDILPTLSAVCDKLKNRLDTDVKQLNSKVSGIKKGWKYDFETKAGKYIQNLSGKSNLDEMNKLFQLSSEEIERIQQLHNVLNNDSFKIRKASEAAIERLDFFLEQAQKVRAELSDDLVNIIKGELEAVKKAKNVAKAFTSGQFDDSFLKGTGSQTWRILWDAAQKYSQTEAYPGEIVPIVSDDVQCVLCQQLLDSMAKNRFVKFHEFCNDTSQQLCREAEKVLAKRKTQFDNMILLLPELKKVEADLSSLKKEEYFQIENFINTLDERLSKVRLNLSTDTWVDLPSILFLPESIISGIVKNFKEVVQTQISTNDPVARKKLAEELSELKMRQWLFDNQQEILDQIERFRIISNLESYEKDLNTNPITAKSTELTKKFVTDVFKKRFSEELKSLGLKTLEVEWSQIKGKKGEAQFGLRLIRALSKGGVADIASEGEQRCIALAAFLSELSQASHYSTLVFDDPVSSLDHGHRAKIAERLVLESQYRQVIVFTHDVIFLNDLKNFSEAAEKEPKILTLEWNDDKPGKYIDGLPWDIKSTKECIHELEIDQRKLKNKWNSRPSTQNIADMRQAYSKLRSTMERIIEKNLLDGIVCRFTSYIDTKSIVNIVGIPQEECDQISTLITKCHRITEAHAPSPLDSVPNPDEFMADITVAKELIEIIKRRKSSKNKKSA